MSADGQGELYFTHSFIEEGRLMKAYATGDILAAEDLKRVCGRVKRLQKKYFKI